MTTSLITSPGICYASVCSDEGPLNAARWLNANYPTGISSAWKPSDDPTFAGGPPNPCPCEQQPGFLHYLMNC
jgi:hypothetical protein